MNSLFRYIVALLGLFLMGASAHQKVHTTILTVAQTPAPLQGMTPALAVRTQATMLVKVVATPTHTNSPLAAASGYDTSTLDDDGLATSSHRVPQLHAAGVSFKDPGFVALTLAFGLISFGMMFI